MITRQAFSVAALSAVLILSLHGGCLARSLEQAQEPTTPVTVIEGALQAATLDPKCDGVSVGGRGGCGGRLAVDGEIVNVPASVTVLLVDGADSTAVAWGDLFGEDDSTSVVGDTATVAASDDDGVLEARSITIRASAGGRSNSIRTLAKGSDKDPGEVPVPKGELRKFTLVLDRMPVPYSNANGTGVKTVITVNGQYPGPAIRAKHGDTLQVTVVNKLGQKTTIHWHGFTQRNTPWADGTPGVSQCLLRDRSPHETLVYTFQASLSGTFWYHAHALDEYVDGLFGPLVIEARPEVYAGRYSAEWIWQVHDWYNQPAGELRKVYTSAADPDGFEPLPDAVAVNGKFDRELVYTAPRDGRARVRLINSAAISMYNVSVDGLPLELIELDGQTIEPHVVPWVVVSVGQRASFVLDFGRLAAALEGEKAIRFRVSAVEESFPVGYQGDYGWQGERMLHPDLYGRISLDGGKTRHVSYPPSRVPRLPLNAPDFNVISAKPVPYFAVPPADHVMNFSFVFRNTPDGRNLAFVNGRSYVEASEIPKDPLLFEVIDLGHDVVGAPRDLVDSRNDGGSEGKRALVMNHRSRWYVPIGAWVDILVSNYDGGPHPIHIHGHRFFVVEASEVPGSRAANAPNYLQRDVVTVRASPDGVTPATLRLRFYANNPGAFLLHCHIDWHLDAGLGGVIVEGDTALRQQGDRVPTPMLENCDYHRRKERDPRHGRGGEGRGGN